MACIGATSVASTPPKPSRPALEVLHVAVAAQPFEPTLLVLPAHLLDEYPLNLIADLVEWLDAGVLAVLSVKEEAALGQDDGIRGLALLDRKERLTEFRLQVGALHPSPVAALGAAGVGAV